MWRRRRRWKKRGNRRRREGRVGQRLASCLVEIVVLVLVLVMVLVMVMLKLAILIDVFAVMDKIGYITAMCIVFDINVVRVVVKLDPVYVFRLSRPVSAAVSVSNPRRRKD